VLQLSSVLAFEPVNLPSNHFYFGLFSLLLHIHLYVYVACACECAFLLVLAFNSGNSRMAFLSTTNLFACALNTFIILSQFDIFCLALEKKEEVGESILKGGAGYNESPYFYLSATTVQTVEINCNKF